MFERLTRILDNFAKLDNDKIFLSIISETGVQKYIISLNTTEQMFLDGVNSDGISFGSYDESTFDTFGKGTYFTSERVSIDDIGFIRSETVSKDISYGDDYILKDSLKNGLYDSYKVIVDSGGFTLSADTMKTEGSGFNKGKRIDLESKYGDIIGLNEKSENELARAIIPLVVQEIRKTLFS